MRIPTSRFLVGCAIVGGIVGQSGADVAIAQVPLAQVIDAVRLSVPGGNFFSPRINDRGEVLLGGASGSYVRDTRGGWHRLCGVKSGCAWASSINSHGQIAGQIAVRVEGPSDYYFHDADYWFPAIWDASAQEWTRLPGFDKASGWVDEQGRILQSSLPILTDNGQIVASVWNLSTYLGFYIWSPETQVPRLVRSTGWATVDVNNRGDVLGRYGIWTAANEQFGRLPSNSTGGLPTPFAINDSGDVVGQMSFPSAQPHGCSQRVDSHAALWPSGGGLQDLGVLGGFFGEDDCGPAWQGTSIAWAVNDLGQIVGQSTTDAGTYGAFLWDKDGGMQRFPVRSRSSAAIGTNNRGQVLVYLDGDIWILTVPVPASDSTPPVVTVPGDIAVDATSANGATVAFAVSAADPDDAAGPVTCSPASGSLFPIGQTTVTCSSTDTNGNTGTAQFNVTVRSPAQITSNLLGTVQAINLQQAGNLLQGALGALETGQIVTACNQLSAFSHQVRAQSGRRLSAVQAGALIQSSSAAQSSLGCR